MQLESHGSARAASTTGVGVSEVITILVRVLLARLIDAAALWAMHKLARKFGVA